MQAIIKLCFQDGILTFSILFLLSHTDSDTKAFFYIFIQVERFKIIMQLFYYPHRILFKFYLNSEKLSCSKPSISGIFYHIWNFKDSTVLLSYCRRP